MKLPGIDRAVVDAAKIHDYLLCESHPVGRFKAAFFYGLGYSAPAWQGLAENLRQHAMGNEAVAAEANEYGQKYEVRGKLKGPTGRTAIVVAVWIVRRGERFPRFVTAFPGARS